MAKIIRKKICVMGLGYIGLPTASLLATKGFFVHGVDINSERIESIKHGESNLAEPDLDILVKSAVHSGNLTASKEPVAADIFMLTVPTPFCGNHVPDLSFVDAATHSIAPYLAAGNLVILESTCPVGTTEKIQSMLTQLRPDLVSNVPGRSNELRVYLAHCPERVLPGQILKELIDNDRIIGGVDRVSAEKAANFYHKFVNGHIFLTTARMAELSKLTENAFRDVNIAFANELSLICDKLGINVWELIKLANRHPRVNILQPGPGVGGHCIAVDPWFIVDSFPEEARLIKIAREVNDYKPQYLIDKIMQIAKSYDNPAIACLGLTFKANVSDLRESPALEITKVLAEQISGRIFIAEPFITSLPESLAKFENVQLTELEDALQKADIIILLVDHHVFREIDRSLLQMKIVIDTRGIWQCEGIHAI
jgi:UDP-N-acetyl-D-mannosaminuronic acid dehydrogenase